MPPTSPASRQSGFSLIELLIGMVIALEILVAALTVFDVHNRMARIQLQITDMQQSLRVAQYDMVRTTRMAGRGGMPAQFRVDPDDLSVPWLRGLAIESRDNVDEGDDSRVSLLEAEPKAVAGTDILTVRGCLSGTMLQMDPTNPGDFTNTSMVVRKALPNGRTQDLAQLLEADYEGPVLLQSAVNRELFAVAEVSAVAGDEDVATLTISFASATAPPNPLVTAPPAGFIPGFACTLEEYRYYVRRNYETPGDDTTPLKPRLARARMIPGTEIPFGDDDANLSLDLADEIFDLQVALGFDTDYHSAGSAAGSFDDDVNAVGTDDVFFEGADDAARAADDWLGNSTDDDPSEAQYRVNALIPARPVRLYYVRISTLGRTARPDPKYEAPDFDATAGEDLIENNDYDAAPANVFKSRENRQFRHRLLQTVVDLRNI
jgi:prepilin-type N-terminal cleavage/methylation domain-containing protein